MDLTISNVEVVSELEITKTQAHTKEDLQRQDMAYQAHPRSSPLPQTALSSG